MNEKLVIIPTYNEIENINLIIPAVLELEVDFHVLIVDDDSPDGTADEVKNWQLKYPNKVHMLQRKGKLGLGTAYIAGFKFALDKGYEYIFEMDADFSHNPKDLLRLFKACQDGADISIGSRYVKGGGLENWPLDRKLLSYGASIYVRSITWMMIKDPTAGFVCYTNKVLSTFDLNKIRFIGYAFQIEMKYSAWKNGFKLVEVPITFKDRELGHSKMNSNIVSEAMKGVISMRWLGMKGYYKA
ncbi:MAG TPA: dolichyl-phosphate beta-D-mannosyltransferase [Saprospirales bacterium]|nr:polyprenol monophosphomannose synthase [Saprospiraceae bacterium]HAV28737.1 dolichyl-phosphate beta-D-mannosyltransferase [Saprospirales bacterium]HAW04596.1 dolichyl-phosphate beta-D-mannosyltransferase [Saprospirales bacterium]